jgi:hypothetical protein
VMLSNFRLSISAFIHPAASDSNGFALDHAGN